MYRRMLVPLDGSELAEGVLTCAKELAGRLDLDVILLYVYSPDALEFAPMYQAYVERAAETIQRQSQEVRQETGIQSESKPTEVRGELAVGYPAEEILRYADENDIDLILMATHGRSGIKRWTMGSVADKVLRASNIPVLLVRAGIPDEVTCALWPMKTMLVLLDGSELAEAVLQHVEALTKQRSNEPLDVVLLRVCEPPTTPSYDSPDFSGVPLNWGDYVQQETIRGKQAAHEYLAKVEKRLKESNITVRSEVLEGKADEKIVDYANKTQFNLIVMAPHGRSGLSRWVYGSVAENVLQGVSSPILLVRPQ